MGRVYTVPNEAEEYNTHDGRVRNYQFFSSAYNISSNAGETDYGFQAAQEYTTTYKTGGDEDPLETSTLDGMLVVGSASVGASNGASYWTRSATGSQDGFDAGYGETFISSGSNSSTGEGFAQTDFPNGESATWSTAVDQSGSGTFSSYYNSGITQDNNGGNFTEDNNGVTAENSWTIEQTVSGYATATVWPATYMGTSYDLDEENTTWTEVVTLDAVTSSSWFTTLQDSERITSVETYEQMSTISTISTGIVPAKNVGSWAGDYTSTHQNSKPQAAPSLGYAQPPQQILIPFFNKHDEGLAVRYAVGNPRENHFEYSVAGSAGDIASEYGDSWFNGTTTSNSIDEIWVTNMTDTEFGGSYATVIINEGYTLFYSTVSDGNLVEEAYTVEEDTAEVWGYDGYPDGVVYFDTTGAVLTTTSSTFIVADGDTSNSALINQTTTGAALTVVDSVVNGTSFSYVLWGGLFSGSSMVTNTYSNLNTFSTDGEDAPTIVANSLDIGGATYAATSSNSAAGAEGEAWTQWVGVGHHEATVHGPVAVSGRPAMGYLPFYYSTGDLEKLYAGYASTFISSEAFGNSIKFDDLDEDALTHAQSGMRGRGRTGFDMDTKCRTMTTTFKGTEGTDIVTMPTYVSVSDKSITNTYGRTTDTREADEKFGSNSIAKKFDTTTTTSAIGSYESTTTTAEAVHTHSYTMRWMTPAVSDQDESSRELAWTFRDHHLQSIKGLHGFSLEGDIDVSGSYWRQPILGHSSERTFANGDHDNTLNFGGCGLLYTSYDSKGASETGEISASGHSSLELTPRACIGWEIEPIFANVYYGGYEYHTQVLQDEADHNIRNFSVDTTTNDD